MYTFWWCNSAASTPRVLTRAAANLRKDRESAHTCQGLNTAVGSRNEVLKNSGCVVVDVDPVLFFILYCFIILFLFSSLLFLHQRAT